MHWMALPAWARMLLIFVFLLFPVLAFFFNEPLLIAGFVLVGFTVIFLVIRSPKRKTHNKAKVKRWLRFFLTGMIGFFVLSIFFYMRGWDGAVYISALLAAHCAVLASTALVALWRNT